MESRATKVVARELGTNIKRSAIFGNGTSATATGAPKLPPSKIITKDTTANPSQCVLGKTVMETDQIMEGAFVTSTTDNVMSIEKSIQRREMDEADVDVDRLLNSAGVDRILDPNDLVYIGKKEYNEDFVFEQLMGWYNAGTDIKESLPDMFGCVELPTPSRCFGVSTKIYGPDERKALMDHLKDERAQMQPWPSILRHCFSGYSSDGNADNVSRASAAVARSKTVHSKRKRVTHSSNATTSVSSTEYQTLSDEELNVDVATNMYLPQPLYGSPFLDVTLAQTDAVVRVIKDLTGQKSNGKMNTVHTQQQFDDILPPELPTEWVQCDRKNCLKWRRVAWNVDIDALPDSWNCSMNFWDPENAFCEAPNDEYDPSRESVLGIDNSSHPELKEFAINSWRDVYCVINHFYYEAQVKAVKEKTSKDGKRIKLVKFHYKGWPKNFDEWVEVDGYRVAPHNFYTDPNAATITEQEAVQSMREYDIFGNSVFRSQDSKKVFCTFFQTSRFCTLRRFSYT